MKCGMEACADLSRVPDRKEMELPTCIRNLGCVEEGDCVSSFSLRSGTRDRRTVVLCHYSERLYS